MSALDSLRFLDSACSCGIPYLAQTCGERRIPHCRAQACHMEGRRQGRQPGRTARRRAKARAEARARGNGNGCNSDGRPMQLWWVWQPMWVVVPVLAPAPQASTGGPLEFAPVGRPRRPRPGLWLLRSELQEAVARAQWDLQVWQFEEVVTPTGVWCLWHV